MALYQDGILISGANTLPKMTLADYKAMPADKRPTYWERLDGDYDDVLAEKTDIATVESGTTASRAYSVGELVYVSGTLYRVKTAIASGATFTVGTNVEVTNVNNLIKSLDTQKVVMYAGSTTDYTVNLQFEPQKCSIIRLAPTSSDIFNVTLPHSLIPVTVTSSGYVLTIQGETSYNNADRNYIVIIE